MRVAFSALLAEGRPFLGTFIQSAAPEFVEAAGYAGFRFATVDLEHTYYGPEKTAEMVRAGEAADLCVLARVPALDAVWIKKCLDMGASGVIVPNVDTAEQAAEALPAELKAASPMLMAALTEGGGERLCYVFPCEAEDGSTVTVYVDAKTGEQTKIEIGRT